MTYKNPAGNFIFPIASHIDIVTVAKYAASANEDERLWQENRMNLYPLTKDEANLLLGLLKNALTQASDIPMDDGKLNQSKLTGIDSVIKSGGLKV